MKRFVLLLIVCALLTGCTPAAPAAEGFTFTDDLGREVTVSQPERVACLLGSFADVWYLAGGEVIAAADDAWEDFDLPLSDDAVNLGHTKELSLEALFTAEPDFVIASANTEVDVAWKDTLEAAGIPVAYFDVSNFEDYLRMLKICTDITGREDLYEKNGLDVQAGIETVIKQSNDRLKNREAPSILLLRTSSASVRAKNSKNNVLGEMLATLGCRNIADSDAMLLEELNVESIIKADPDLIFVVPQGSDVAKAEANIRATFDENPAWSQLTAIVEDRVFIMDRMLYNFKPNARWDEAYEKLEDLLAAHTE